MKVALFIPIKLKNQRLPGKNLMELEGKPLCHYIFETVDKLDMIEKKYVFCSDPQICSYIKGNIEFLQRDKALDGSEVKGLEIIEAFVNAVDADVYVLTHVTQPFTKASSIENALKKVLYEGYDSAFSARVLKDYCWFQGKPLNYNMQDIVVTQDLEPVYMETGAFFIFKKEVFKKYHQRIGKTPYLYEVDAYEAIDIDEKEDFEFAQAAAAYLQRSRIKRN